MARRYIDQVMRAAVLEELRNGVQARELSKKYGIAESTISRWRKAENIDAGPHASAVIRSKPLRSDKPQDSSGDSPTDRRKLIQKQLGLVGELLEGGGLKSSDLRNLATASRTLTEADAKLEKEEQQQLAFQHTNSAKLDPKSTSGRQERLEELVSCHANGVLVYADAYFATLDYGESLEKGDEEKGEETWSRLCAVLRSYGIVKVTEDDFEVMDRKTQSDFDAQLRREGYSEEDIEKERKAAWDATPWAGQGLA